MLRQIIAISSCIAGITSAWAGEAGRIVFVTGQVQVADRAGAVDAAVQEGDQLNTGADGYVYIKTADNGFLILRPNSKARIVSYHIDSGNPANTRIKFELSSGVARSISGDSVKKARQNFRFNTPVAAIGVRGTDFVVYTDQQTSRVAVMSGGIVVSGYSGACGPEGGGPCEGSASRELFAGQSGQLLQVQNGQTLPQLLQNPSLSPDKAAPPRGDEPAVKPVLTVVPGVVTEVNLDPQKTANLILIGKQNVPPVPVGPGIVTPPPEQVVVVPPLPPAPREVLWGRWQNVVGNASDPKVLAELDDGSYAKGFVLGSYIIKRKEATALAMPREGTASFKMNSGEGILTKTGDQPLAAVAQDGYLNIDFGARSFNTGLTLTSPTQKMNVSGQGDITLKGEFISSPASNSIIRGYLGGPRAEEAVYIFKAVTPTMTGEGVVRWSR